MAGVIAAHADDAFESLTQASNTATMFAPLAPFRSMFSALIVSRGWNWRPVSGKGLSIGLEPLARDCVPCRRTLKKPALAAINGDFFLIKPGPYQGDPSGLHITEGELTSRPTGNSFSVPPNGELKIGPVESKLRVIWADGKNRNSPWFERNPPGR